MLTLLTHFPHTNLQDSITLRNELDICYFLLLTYYAVVGTAHERKPSSLTSTAQLQMKVKIFQQMKSVESNIHHRHIVYCYMLDT